MGGLFKGLPKTSKYKMIDYWLIFCLNILILTFAWHTFVGYLLNEDNPVRGSRNKVSPEFEILERRKVMAGRANTLGKITILGLIVAFNVIFAMSAVEKYYGK